ncbi:MAG: gephyrin-like molybdotransferase Glp [Minwuia sp.]|uniref:molybdopterin molybdotransferase MoeA n=1 Tax=Minwuia sp. TaxID=2493630 RepID=UPI003A873F8C
MSQITDDCFAFGGPLLRADEALRIIAERTPAVTGQELRALAEAAGHALASDIRARSPSPPHDNAAVDGYAFRGEDLSADSETVLTVAGRAAAGHPHVEPVAGGQAVRIFTGAPMPRGADTVVMQEDIRLEGERLIVPPGLKAGANRRKRGEDITAGRTLLAAGRRIGPAELALAAAGGLDRLPVHRRASVAVVSTGDEITAAGSPLAPGSVYDANAPMLMAMLGRLGVEARHLGIVRDDRKATLEALAEAAEADLVITSGGASTGDEDHVRAAVAELGAVHLWRLAVKPGRPLAFGHVRGTAFVGLPGNPVAVMACFLMFVRPLIDRLEGAAPVPLRRWPVRAGFSATSKPDRLEWLRGTLSVKGGELVANRYPKQGSGIVHSLTDSDGLIEIPEEMTAIAEGDRLGFISFREALA